MPDGLDMKYFVLSPESRDLIHATASRIAMLAYSEAIIEVQPERALEIRNWATLAQTKERARLHNATLLHGEMYADHVSEEPLDVIRANECDATDGGLATSRFRRLWNELVALRTRLYGG